MGDGETEGQGGAARAARRLWIDAARALAIVLVVGIHANFLLEIPQVEYWPGGLIGGALFHQAVPIFLLLGGWLAGQRPPGAVGAGAGRKGRLGRLLAPYLFWNAATLLTLSSLGEELPSWKVPLYLVGGYLQFYFLFTYMQLVLVTRWIDRFLDRRRLTWLLAVSCGCTTAYYAVADALTWSGGDVHTFIELASRLFPSLSAFFFVGLFLGRRPEALAALERRLGLLVVATGLAFCAGYVEYERMIEALGDMPISLLCLAFLPLQLLGALTIVLTLKKLDDAGHGRAPLRALARAGRDSYGIYLCHHIVLFMVVWAERMSGWVPPDRREVPVVWAATLLISWAVVRGLRCLGPLASMLLGEAGAIHGARLCGTDGRRGRS
jgi:surface polysaccharide O-acyltransferase-like enzyme